MIQGWPWRLVQSPEQIAVSGGSLVTQQGQAGRRVIVAWVWGNEPQNIRNHRRVSFYGSQLYSVSTAAVRGHKERLCSFAKDTHLLCNLTHTCLVFLWFPLEMIRVGLWLAQLLLIWSTCIEPMATSHITDWKQAWEESMSGPWFYTLCWLSLASSAETEWMVAIFWGGAMDTA